MTDKCWFRALCALNDDAWKMVVCDGLYPDSSNNNIKSEVTEGWDGRVTLWEKSGDALSVIERWAFG
jgi:hypothetical protein